MGSLSQKSNPTQSGIARVTYSHKMSVFCLSDILALLVYSTSMMLLTTFKMFKILLKSL